MKSRVELDALFALIDRAERYETALLHIQEGARQVLAVPQEVETLVTGMEGVLEEANLALGDAQKGDSRRSVGSGASGASGTVPTLGKIQTIDLNPAPYVFTPLRRWLDENGTREVMFYTDANSGTLICRLMGEGSMGAVGCASAWAGAIEAALEAFRRESE